VSITGLSLACARVVGVVFRVWDDGEDAATGGVAGGGELGCEGCDDVEAASGVLVGARVAYLGLVRAALVGDEYRDVVGAGEGEVDGEHAAGVSAGGVGDGVGGELGCGEHGVVQGRKACQFGADVAADPGDLVGGAGKDAPGSGAPVAAVRCEPALGAGCGCCGQCAALELGNDLGCVAGGRRVGAGGWGRHWFP
jgi:hypothetical protein